VPYDSHSSITNTSKQEHKNHELPIDLWTRISIFQNQGGYENLVSLQKIVKLDAKKCVKNLESWDENNKQEKSNKKEFKKLLHQYRDILMQRLEIDQVIKDKLTNNKDKLESLWRSKSIFDNLYTSGMLIN